MTIGYLENGFSRTASTVNALTAVRRYNYAPGMAGWFSHYALSGVAVAMPAKGGHVIALLDDQAGMEISFSQGKKIVLGFGRGWPLDKTWIDHWNELARSNAKATMSDSIYTFPRLLFLPTGGTLRSARLLSREQASDLGIQIQEIMLTITRDGVTSTPSLFSDLGCTGRVDSNTTGPIAGRDPVNCDSLVLRQLTEDGAR
ncbi:hypothetical protein [Sphingomonas sp. PB4P5]|uniref:hypothetical protein n=1 Tax=Parasphingomonas puruogangriensis TaxID=3096155 RepID=UPI002FC9FA57